MELRDDDLVHVLEVDAGGEALLGAEENPVAAVLQLLAQGMMRLVQQIVLLLRIGAAPDTVQEYTGDTPVKVMTAVEMAAEGPDEIIAIGVRHKVVLESYAKAFCRCPGCASPCRRR